MWTNFLLHLLPLSLSTDSAKKAQITEVRGYFTLCCFLLSLQSFVLVCCMVRCIHMMGHTIFSSYVMYTFAIPFSVDLTDAVPIRNGPCPWEKDWPQEGRRLWRDNIQEGRLFHLSLYLSLPFVGLLVVTIFTNYFPPTLYSVVLFSVDRLQTTSSALQGAIQLGIGYTVGNLSSKPERDVLMQDFYVVESIFFPRCTCMSGCVFMCTCVTSI